MKYSSHIRIASYRFEFVFVFDRHYFKLMRITVAILGLARITVASASSGQGHVHLGTLGNGYSAPITLAEVSDISNVLNKPNSRYDITPAAHVMLEALLSDGAIERLNEDQKRSIGADLRAEFSRIESLANRNRAAIREKVNAIEVAFADQLLDLEKHMLQRIDYEHLNMAMFQAVNNMLDSIYTANPQFREVTKEDVALRLQNYNFQTEFFHQIHLQHVLDHYETLTPAQRKRVKGWFLNV